MMHVPHPVDRKSGSKLVYVATRFPMWPVAKAAHEALKRAGHHPTSGWVEVAESLDGRETPLSNHKHHAEEDVRQLGQSDALLLIVPREGGTGMWFELGFAWARGQRIHCIPATYRGTKYRTIFTELDGVRHHRSLLEAIAAIGEGL